MKIVFIAQPIDDITPRAHATSVALWIRHVAKHLVARGHQVAVIGNNGGRFHTKVTEQGGTEYVLTPTLINALVNRIGLGIARVMSGREPQRASHVHAGWHHRPFGVLAAGAAAARRADVIHVMNYSQLVPDIRRRNPNATVVLHMHCEWLSQCPREVIAPRLQQADIIVGCSQYITEMIAERFPEHASRCLAVANAAEAVPEELVAEPSGRRVIFVGRLSPEKGVHELIVAFRTLLERFPDASLHLIGAAGSTPVDYLVGLSSDPHVQALKKFYDRRRRRRGSSRDFYLETLERLAGPELGRRIVFEGHVDHDSIREHYRQASVLVNPSLSESFGITVVEAMMMQVPVVATCIGGMQQTVVDGETGLVVAPADAPALANAIGMLFADPDLACRLGKAGRVRALTHFSWARAADRLIEAYASVPKRQLQG